MGTYDRVGAPKAPRRRAPRSATRVPPRHARPVIPAPALPPGLAEAATPFLPAGPAEPLVLPDELRALLDTRPARPAPLPSGVDLRRTPPNPALTARLAPHACLRMSVLPWRRVGGTTVLLSSDFARTTPHLPRLEALFGPVRLMPCGEATLRGAILGVGSSELVARAETRVSAENSCRGLTGGRTSLAYIGVAAVLGLTATLFAPWGVLALLTVITLTTLLASTLLKGLALLAHLTAPRRQPLPLARSDLPLISLLVPLYKEREIADHLLARLAELDYPRDRLDLCLILEADDLTTRQALNTANLPPWAQTVTVPEGTLKTKPRALNYALDFCRGEIVGIYDAEDAPAPDQLRQVAAHFAVAAPNVACLQGVLDYYNPRANWLARCFTLEYAGWFRVLLPGLVRLGLIVPLGGTTLFIRRQVLEKLGGWDAHNVTEDADLGIRIARAGYRTELIDTVTEEEANARAWPWVRQRSRWLKGYGATWVVHSRRPLRLIREVGAIRALGIQVLLLGTLTQFLLAPVLWTLWAIVLALPASVAERVNGGVAWAVAGVLVVSWAINIATSVAGARAAGKTRLAGWSLTMGLYFPLATVAAWKAIWELLRKPFYWDKTSHGHSL